MYELCDGKVWRAVEAMINGLLTQDQREDFRIDMNSFGRTSQQICFGCAATCAVQQLVGINLKADTITHRYETLNVDRGDIYEFEHAINALRMGALGVLFDYFKKPRTLVSFRRLPILHTYNWRTGIQEYKTLLIALKEFDI